MNTIPLLQYRTVESGGTSLEAMLNSLHGLRWRIEAIHYTGRLTPESDTRWTIIAYRQIGWHDAEEK